MVASLEGRRALVTGASSGIGRAVAKALAAEGAEVILAARRLPALVDLAREIEGSGGRATFVQCDVTDEAAVGRLAAVAGDGGRPLDVLVANAGTLGPVRPLSAVTAEAWAEVISTNLTSNQRLIRHLDPLLRASGGGRVVFISSGAGNGAEMWSNWGPYAVSKCALDALARTYAAETRDDGVVVTLVNPGPIRTAMRAEAAPDEDPETIPSPDDIAPEIVRLCSSGHAETGKVYDFTVRRLLSFRGVG